MADDHEAMVGELDKLSGKDLYYKERVATKAA